VGTNRIADSFKLNDIKEIASRRWRNNKLIGSVMYLEMATSKLARMANGKVLIVLFIAALLFQLIFECRNRTLTAYSGEPQPTLDSDVCYGPQKAHELFGKLGDRGRQLYAWTEITVDLIFPIIYSFFLSLLIIYIFQKSSSNKSLQSLAILPFVAMLFDYGENTLIAFMLFAYPQKYFAVAWVASLFTKLKWILLAVSFAAILFGLIRLVIKSLRH
jgi:hypothetical protein